MEGFSKSTKVGVFLTADLSKSAKLGEGISVGRFEQICSDRF